MPRSIRSCGKILIGRLGMIPGLIKQANMLLQNMMANGDVVVNFLGNFFLFFLVFGYGKLCMLMKLKQKKKENYHR